MKRYEFVVTGRYPFPTDMLRYDVCSPVDPGDVSRIEASINGRFKQREGQSYADRFDIRLVSFRKPPTVDRWNSFGWSCELIREEKVT